MINIKNINALFFFIFLGHTLLKNSIFDDETQSYSIIKNRNDIISKLTKYSNATLEKFEINIKVFLKNKLKSLQSSFNLVLSDKKLQTLAERLNNQIKNNNNNNKIIKKINKKLENIKLEKIIRHDLKRQFECSINRKDIEDILTSIKNAFDCIVNNFTSLLYKITSEENLNTSYHKTVEQIENTYNKSINQIKKIIEKSNWIDITNIKYDKTKSASEEDYKQYTLSKPSIKQIKNHSYKIIRKNTKFEYQSHKRLFEDSSEEEQNDFEEQKNLINEVIEKTENSFEFIEKDIKSENNSLIEFKNLFEDSSEEQNNSIIKSSFDKSIEENIRSEPSFDEKQNNLEEKNKSKLIEPNKYIEKKGKIIADTVNLNLSETKEKLNKTHKLNSSFLKKIFSAKMSMLKKSLFALTVLSIAIISYKVFFSET